MPLYYSTPQSDCPSIQIRRTTTYTFTGSFADITMDVTDVNNDATYLTHDGGSTERINILVSGLYEVSYQFQTAAQATAREVYGQVVLNASTVLNGSGASVAVTATSSATGPSTVNVTFLANLTAGDYIRLQAYSSSTAATMVAGATLAAVKLTGGKGDTGPSGAMSVGSPVTANGTITITSSSDVLATGMTVTPVEGTYLCFFTGACWMVNPDSTHFTYSSIYAGGSQVTGSEVPNSDGVGFATPFCCVAVCTVNGTQAIEGRWRRDAGGGTASMVGTRTLNYLKIG